MINTQFEGQRFLALETFRKDGTPVSTPVGFALDSDSFVIYTQITSGKVKRIRANTNVRIAPSTGSGKPLGEWVKATATILDDAESVRVHKLIKARYGMVWRMIETTNSIRSRLRGRGAAKWIGIRVKHQDI